MSEQGADAFLERMQSDETFRERVLEIEDVEARVAFVNAEGFDCTAEEIRQEGYRLSDREIDSVAGGWGCSCDGTDCACYDAGDGWGL